MEITAWREVNQKVLAYRKLKMQMDALKAQADAIKAELFILVEANGKWTDDEGHARMVQRRPSITFDTKALIALCKSVPEVNDKLAPHRQVKAGYSYLQVK